MKNRTKKMNENDISLLIKEAKPLYFARKRQKKQILALSTMFACVLFVSPFFMQSANTGYIYDFDGMTEEINLTQNGSIIEDMGLPVDEYGLLKVI